VAGDAPTRDQLEFFRDLGVRDVFFDRPAATPAASVVPGSMHDLGALKTHLEGCPRCKLSKTRTNIVFGQGNPKAGRTRDDVFIANVLKCRPPNNRNPEPDEVAACRPFLDEQIRLIAPRVIVTLGTFAAQAILETDEPIGRMRGHWRTVRGVRVMPTFHPAFLLRSPERKKDVWEDMKLVRDFLAEK